MRTLDEPRIVDVFAQHPVQPYRQLPRDGHLGQRTASSVRQTLIVAPQLRLMPHRTLRRFHQQPAHKGTPLLADMPQTLLASAGVFAGNQSEVAGHLLAPRESLGWSQG